MQSGQVKIKWICNALDQDIDGCGKSFERVYILVEWNMGDCNTICPVCGRELYQDSDEFVIIKVNQCKLNTKEKHSQLPLD